jgi:type IV pilus assembly protein PilQ
MFDAQNHSTGRMIHSGGHRFAIAAALVVIAGTTSSLAQTENNNAGLAGLAQMAKDAAAAKLAPAARPATEQAASEQPSDRPRGLEHEDSQIAVNDDLIVDLHVNDEELANVLEMLSIQSQRNIVASKNVSAKVTANLYGVTFFEALDAILHVNGFGYIERGNFIYVYTLDELKEIEKQSRQRVSAVLKLNYLNAIDAAEFVKPLLSEGGAIKTNGKTATFTIPDKAPTGADEYANDSTLVVYDYEENLEEIKKLVVSIDTRPAQVLVEATILQAELTENNAFGVDFALVGDLNFTDFANVGGPIKAVDQLIAGKSSGITNGTTSTVAVPDDREGRAIVSSPGQTSGPGTLKLGLVDSDVAIFMKLLDEVTDTTILSNPKILALNRQPARVLVGRKVGYLNTTSTETSTTQTVEFLDTGTQLYVRPFVTSEGLIRMELKPQVSEAVIREARDATGAAVTIPDEVTNEVVTNVMVRDGQTIVLGGLFRDSTQSSRRQVPVLGDIPLIGAAFRGHDDEIKRSEIIFLVTPSIVSDEVLLAGGDKAKAQVDMARAGAREGTLPFSRTRMTGQILVEAQRLAEAGKNEEAMWKVNQALAMDPHMIEAQVLREKLSGNRKVWPSNSMLQDVLKAELGATKQKSDASGFTPDAGFTTPTAPAASTEHASFTPPANGPVTGEPAPAFTQATPADGQNFASQTPAPSFNAAAEAAGATTFNTTGTFAATTDPKLQILRTSPQRRTPNPLFTLRNRVSPTATQAGTSPATQPANQTPATSGEQASVPTDGSK